MKLLLWLFGVACGVGIVLAYQAMEDALADDDLTVVHLEDGIVGMGEPEDEGE